MGAEGTMLTVYGSSLIRWEVDGKVFVQTLIVVGPLTTRSGHFGPGFFKRL